MNRDNKIKYISDEIENSNIDRNYIIKYILDENIKYTKNKNGIFVNLSILDDKNIDIMYEYMSEKKYDTFEQKRDKEITKYKNTTDITDTTDIKKDTTDTDIKKDKETIDKNIKKTFKQIDNLTDIDLQIIELSKTI